MKAVVMAGGFGTRIQPLTNSIPKPMLPVINKPMMEHIIKNLKAAGIEEFIILLYFMPEVIKDYFKDGKKLGITIRYVVPDDDYGTAGAVKYAQEYLKDDSFIIVSGDLVTDFDFKHIIDYHNLKHSSLTIALTPVENPLDFGVVIARSDGKIEKFLEKPSWGEVFSDTINTGIYILEPYILDSIPKEENYDFGKDLFPALMNSNVTIWGCNVKGYWRDVGNPHSYRELHDDILNEKIDLHVSSKHTLVENTPIHSQEMIDVETIKISGKVIVGKNVRIGKDVNLHNVVIGNNVFIDNGSHISESVIWDNVEIKSGVHLNHAVICNNVSIGKKVKARHGVIIAEKCEIDNLVSFENDVIVWPNKVIDEASIVSNNVIWGKKYKNTIFENGSVIGRTNLELSCEMATKLAESFGSILPVGSTVYVSRDYHRSSRMLKRAFLGGLLSTGINVLDLRLACPSVMRFNLAHHDEIIAGVHFEESMENQINTQITFYTGEGLNIDTNSEKGMERIFFKESFRRVNYTEIGEILENGHISDIYSKHFLEHLDFLTIKHGEFRIALDFLFGTASSILPEVLNELDIDAVTLNAYLNDKKLTKVPNRIEKSKKELSDIVKGMKLDLGYIMYPDSKVFDIVCENGMVLERHIALLLFLELLNTQGDEKRILLPVWAPDFMDHCFNNLIIERTKITNLKASELSKYDFIGTTAGSYAFPEFSLNFDSLFSCIKLIELLSFKNKPISKITMEFESFFYLETRFPCVNGHKGKMMRKFLEDSTDKEASHVDGVKIWIDKKAWILMIPDQNSDFLRLYIQAANKIGGEKILRDYTKKIEQWINE
ncbi:MAG: sugar phosphate nucleotidyltransferase [Sulfuricurvum sp.]|jgi:mannose-1-phosphate guanylyltransferase/phosphomannomutase